MAGVRVLPLAVLVVLASACGASEQVPPPTGERVSGHGLQITLPTGWHGDVTKLGPQHATTLRAATFPLGPLEDVGQEAQRTMGPDDLLIVVADYGVVLASPPPDPPPIRVGRGDVSNHEGFGEPVAGTTVRVGVTTLQVWVVAARAPSDGQLEQANAVLATLRHERAGHVHRDEEVGLVAPVPHGWHAARSLTGFVSPREVLALASYPLRGGAEAGECAPDTARRDMPADGTFVWLLEYEGELPPDRFPPRPERFRLDRARFAPGTSCFDGPGWTTTFRAPRRQFQLLVAFGRGPSDEQLREVESILDGLEVAETGAPFPDPFEGWPLLGGSTPDSMRAPPGWAAAAAEFRPHEDPPPRALFFASNRPLPLLPSRHVERARMPGDFPDLVLAHGFPDDAVLVWALEESEGRPLAGEYPPIDRDWPSREDFRRVEIATKPAPQVRWLVASGEWMGHRFSVWIARGPDASREDIELALTAAGTLAVSGCDRGVGARCTPNG